MNACPSVTYQASAPPVLPNQHFSAAFSADIPIQCQASCVTDDKATTCGRGLGRVN